jgi:hypothetical protein
MDKNVMNDGAAKTQSNAVSPESTVISEEEEWRNLVGALAAEQPSKITNHADDEDDAVGESKLGRGSRKGAPRKKNRNVGGWVSPAFAKMINRVWLEGDQYDPNLNFSTFVPQAGDIVM